MSEKNFNVKRQLFYIGLLLFALGIALVLAGFAVPSPIPMPTYESGELTYFFPFLNYLVIGGIALAVVALFMEKRNGGEK